MAELVQLYKDKEKTKPIYPYVKGESIVLNNNTTLDEVLSNFKDRYLSLKLASSIQVNSTTLGNGYFLIDSSCATEIGLPTSTYILNNMSWEEKKDFYGVQTVYERAGLERVYTRTCNNGTWGKWHVITGKDSGWINGNSCLSGYKNGIIRYRKTGNIAQLSLDAVNTTTQNGGMVDTPFTLPVNYSNGGVFQSFASMCRGALVGEIFTYNGYQWTFRSLNTTALYGGFTWICDNLD